MSKSKYFSLEGYPIDILESTNTSPQETLLKNRNIEPEGAGFFFDPKISDLHDPYLMPDMRQSVERVLDAREKNERIVIFGDYDVDGVSSTALLVKFLTEIGCQVSYRLPHRVHDGYGLKPYFFDELAEKNVKLVITVDCGTRDIEAIRHAKTLGIDVIVTDHHAVPDTIPTEVIGIINPKRKDSIYPFSGLAGAGVAFKLLHALALAIENKEMTIAKNGESEGDKLSESDESRKLSGEANEFLSSSGPFGTFQSGKVQTYANNMDGSASFGIVATKSTENGVGKIYSILTKYIDLASLGTVADCMPLVGENRTITTLGLKQMKNSESAGLRKFVEGIDTVEGNADVIGFQIGPRINASGRMDTPLTALRWLLASEERCDEFLSEIESLNQTRQEVVKVFSEKALTEANPDDGILFFHHRDLEHGIIGLVAGKLTEAYNRPSIVLCDGHVAMNSEQGTANNERNTGNREYEKMMIELNGGIGQERKTLIASCRSPEWCNLVELLDECREYFVRYGGHRQAAGFTIKKAKFDEFKIFIQAKFREKYQHAELPKKTITVESTLRVDQIHLENVGIIEKFRPFGIGNRKPLFLIEDVTLAEWKYLGEGEKHITFRIMEDPSIKFLMWNIGDMKHILSTGNIISCVIELDRNTWKGKSSVQCIVRHFATSHD